ncbi:MAG: hypothetical protein VB085_03660 [Peptococcaceae bacterium]|nr:hypothetical protein [Peptococcaceae bacterium]
MVALGLLASVTAVIGADCFFPVNPGAGNPAKGINSGFLGRRGRLLDICGGPWEPKAVLNGENSGWRRCVL